MPINKKSKINNAVTRLHLWLGLISGIVVCILGITGCLYVFQTEITNDVHREELFIDPPVSHSSFLSLSLLKEKAQAALGKEYTINYITTYSSPHRAWEFMAYQPGNPNAITFPGSIDYYRSVFINPYTGQITGQINYLRNFFVIVKYIHWSLYLSTKYGQPVTGWATLIFVISLITGFIMWIPKRWNKAGKNKAFKVSWRAKWRILNYDLHNVLGFYALIVALILALTGMVYSFNWFKSAMYAAGSWSLAPPSAQVFQSADSLHKTTDPLDKAFLASINKDPLAKRYLIVLPGAGSAPLMINAYPEKEVYYDANTLYFDQYSGKQLGTQFYKKMNNGEKLIMMNYDLHVGAIGGLPGKIIAFLISLVCASLPVTGFIIWWGWKKRKSRNNTILRKHNDKERLVIHDAAID